MEKPVQSSLESVRNAPREHFLRVGKNEARARSGFSLPSLLLLLLVAGGIAYAAYRWWYSPTPSVFPLGSDSRNHAPTPPGFGAIRWHMPPGALRAVEGVPPFRTSTSAIAYQVTTLNRPCLVTYAFRQEQLCGARLQFAVPESAFLPALPPDRAQKCYQWLKRQLEDRYGTGIENKTTRPRPEAEEFERRWRAARKRYEDNAERMRQRYATYEEAAKHIEHDLAADRRYIAELEQWLEDTRAADRNDPLLATLSTRWSSGEVTIDLLADFTGEFSSLEIRYKTDPARRRSAAGNEL